MRAVSPLGRVDSGETVDAATGQIQRTLAVDGDVIGDAIVLATAEIQAMIAHGDDVAVDDRAGRHIVKVDRAAAGAVESLAERMEEIVADDRSSLAPVAGTGVNGAGVAGMQADIVHDVVLDQVIVALKENCLMLGLVDEVMANLVAHSVDGRSRLIRADDAAEVMDVVVFNQMIAGSERVADAAVRFNAPFAEIVKVAADDGAVLPANDVDRPTADVSQCAAGDRQACTLFCHHGRLPAAFQHESFESCVSHVRSRDQVIGGGHCNRKLFRIAVRPEVNSAGRTIDGPFSRPIDLTNHVEGEKLLAGLIAE